MLWEEGKAALEQLLKFMVHPAISSINLTAALGSLATIARQRPMFMAEVIQAYETLHGKRRLTGCHRHPWEQSVPGADRTPQRSRAVRGEGVPGSSRSPGESWIPEVPTATSRGAGDPNILGPGSRAPAFHLD